MTGDDIDEFSAQQEARRQLPLRFTWGDMHRSLRPRRSELYDVCDAAGHVAESRFGRGIRLWEDANWLKQVMIEICVLPDKIWRRPKGWVDPAPSLIGGDFLVLPLLYRLEDVVSRTDEELVEQFVGDAPTVLDEAARRRRWGTVPWDGVVPAGGIQTSRMPLSAAKRERALERLWRVLDAAGADPSRPAAEVLESVGNELYARGKTACQEFNTGLHFALFELDREVYQRQPVRDRGEHPSRPPIPLSDDTFLYARAAVVLSGKDTFDRVLEEPMEFAAAPRDMDAEGLLSLPEEVLEALDGELQPPPGLPSYETGSNKQHWTAAE